MDEPEANWSYKAGSASDSLNAAADTNPPEISEITWTASEYVEHEKDAIWYLIMSGVSLVAVGAVFLVTRDWLTVATIALAILVIGIYAGRKPLNKDYSIGESGLKVGDKVYHFGQFRSFSLVDEGAINSIWLRPLK